MKKLKKTVGRLAIVGVMLCSMTMAHAMPTSGTGAMSSVSDSLNNPALSATGVRHVVNFDPVSTASIDRVEITMHSTTDAPSSPALYDMTGASLTSQTVWSTGTVTATVASNVVTIMRAEGPVAPAGGTLAIVLDGLVNPSTLGTYYVTVATMDGPTYIDASTTSFPLSNAASVGATVAPYFSFTVGDNGIKDNPSDDTSDVDVTLGGITGTSTSNPITGGGVDGHVLRVTTNAPNGYTITVTDNGNGLTLSTATTANSSMRTVDDSTAPVNPVIFDYNSNTPPPADTEAYYFTISGANVVATLNAFNSLPGLIAKTIVSASGAVSDDGHIILFHAQGHPDSVQGTYEDEVTYTATPNF